MQLRTMDEATLLHKALHGLPVWLGANWTTLAVTHASLPLAPGDHRKAEQLGGRAVREAGRPSLG